MASQVLSGTGNVSYTNNTGQNVRIVINYCRVSGSGATINWGTGASAQIPTSAAFGRNLAFIGGFGGASGYLAGNNMSTSSFSGALEFAVPTELILSNGQTFSITKTSLSTIEAYNIVVIPEAG